MVYVYAITDSTAAAPGGLMDRTPGIGAAPLEARTCDALAAVFSRHPAQSIKPAPENVWRHEQVVEVIMRRHAVLPARFGTLFRDDAGLDAALLRNCRPLLAGLERVSGCVELGLRVLWEPGAAAGPEQPADGSGRAYMAARLAEERARREQRRRAEVIADELHKPLAALATECATRVLARPEVLLSAAYLVRNEIAQAFRESVQRLGDARPDLRLLCTGPWPPYHFVPPLLDPPEANLG